MIYHIYCDESRQTKDRYMILGGVIIENSHIKTLQETLSSFRQEEKMLAEFKWSRVSKAKLPQYKRFIDYFFALNDTDNINFHSIIIDNHAINHYKYNQGDKEIGFYKFYYQLLVNCFGKWYANGKSNTRFLVYLDERNTTYSLTEFKKILNNGMWKKFQNPSDPFRAVEPRNSKHFDLLQMADLILGAIGFQKNGYDMLAGSSTAKIELVEYIASKAGVYNLGWNTNYSRKRFKIWNFKLQK